MQLRRRLQKAEESVGDFEMAAEQKFQEAQEPAGLGRFDAGIYPIDCSAETWLKLAAFRIDGANTADAERRVCRQRVVS